jgi:hypothetical protein
MCRSSGDSLEDLAVMDKFTRGRFAYRALNAFATLEDQLAGRIAEGTDADVRRSTGVQMPSRIDAVAAINREQQSRFGN